MGSTTFLVAPAVAGGALLACWAPRLAAASTEPALEVLQDVHDPVAEEEYRPGTAT